MTLKLSSLADRIRDDGAAAWDVHSKARAAQANGEDVVLMSIGDNTLNTDARIIDRATEAMQAGDTHYVDCSGRDTLREAVAEHLSGRFDRSVDANEVIISAGTQNALFIASCLLLEPGDEVIVADPMYVTYSATLMALGAKIIPLPCPANLDFHPDLSQLDKLVTSRTKAIFFATPVNPTGVIFTAEELEILAACAVKHGLWVVSDEVYSELAFDTRPTAMASIEGMKDRCITIGSLSKSHSMTGWRIGWSCGPAEYNDAADAFHLASTYGLPGFLQEAGAVAIRQDPAPLRDHYRELLDIAMAELENLPEIKVTRPQSGMFILLPVAQTGMSSAQFVEKLYEETSVSVLDAELFGADLKDMVRVTFALQEDRLRKGMSRIVSFYKKHLKA